ncbi:MAG TPA: hypothetical protein VM912_01600 [Terriglobales bacterium]|nr:hypothetical protein [Terriglobales bacterium]
MSAISAKFFANGFHITIADDLTPAWDREFNDQRNLRPSDGEHRHRLSAGEAITSIAVLGGLHHEYRLDCAAA